MHNRQQHQREVRAFLQNQFSIHHWEFTFPHGWGNESYFAHGNGQTYFVKLGAPVANYQVMATLGLTPPVVATGMLEDSTSLLIQPYIDGRKPSRADFRLHLDRIAGIINTMHHSAEVRRVLPEASSDQYDVLGLEALAQIRQKWEKHKAQVPAVAGWVDENLNHLAQQLEGLEGAGPVASHNDICNANWLITADWQVYLIDLDSMAMDDPACDLGAILWWYYPPGVRGRFLEIAGGQNDEGFRNRMRLRMTIHCLSILLPRENSFDRFHPDNFTEALSDFRAILAGEENPQGYG
jgi:thiamine kinase-like enzyme